jgi:hypothetical protein
MATSPARKAKAAVVRRNGGTQQKAADAARVSLRTVKRWEQEPDFQAMLYAQGILQAGPIRILADASAALHDTPSDESMLWVALGRRAPDGDFIPPEVLGTLVVKDAKFLRVVFVMPKDAGAVRAQLEAHVFPLIEDARTAVLMPSALQALQDPDELRSLCRLFCAPTRVAFGEWLRLWRFKAGETKDVRTLEALWEGQSILADVICEHPATFALKARKLGETTICVAFAGYCARVRGANERVHLFSYRERAAIGLLSAVKFGLESLPAHLRLPITRETLKELEFDLGNDDVRTVVSYPTSENTAVEETATHTLMDEFADWPRNEQTYGSLEPTFTAPGATCHIITTGKGPADWSAAYWRECKSGDGLHYPIFIPATARPDRDEAWMTAKRKTMTAASFKVEYALAEEDALAGTAGYKFNHEDIDLTDAPTLRPVPMYHCPRRCRLSWRTEKPQARCPYCKSRVRPVRYIKSWDIGGSARALTHRSARSSTAPPGTSRRLLSSVASKASRFRPSAARSSS